ncbi:hypothetical protein D9M68_789120 [compost metagenome]
MRTRRATWAANDRTARRSCTASAAARPSRTCRSSWAASKAACAASRTTTTGRKRCATASCWTPSATCCCTATPSARWSRWRTASPHANPSNTSPTCAVPPSSAARTTRQPRAGSSWIRARWTSQAMWKTTSTPTRPPANKRRHRAKAVRRKGNNPLFRLRERVGVRVLQITNPSPSTAPEAPAAWPSYRANAR